MERLRLEDLARLVDEQPTAEEQAILDRDPGLRRELDALRSQTRELQSLPAILPPPGGWHELEQELVATGLIRGHAPGAGMWRKWLQVAAAFVLFIGGTAFGWVTGNGPGLDAGANQQASAASGVAEAGVASPASLEDARMAVEAAEGEWRRALGTYQQLFYAENGQQRSRDPIARLAGIETLVAAGEAAVQEAPDDEFLNLFYVNTLMERQQTLNQISLDAWH